MPPTSNGSRSATVIERGDAASLQTVALPGGTRGVVNGTDEAVYALSADTTQLYRVPMIHGTTSVFPLGITAYPYSLTRGPHTLNTFWFTIRRNGSQSDGVAFITQIGVVTKYASPVPSPTSILTFSDNAHMYVTGASCGCAMNSVAIGVIALDGTGATSYPLPIPAGATARLYDGLALGPDHALWFPVRITSRSSDLDYVARFDPIARTFKTFPLTDNLPITGITSFNSALVVAKAPNQLVQVNWAGTVKTYDLETIAQNPVYPVTLPNGDLWVSAMSVQSAGAELVNLSLATQTLTSYGTNASSTGSLTVGPDDNLWFGSNDPVFSIEVLHKLAVSPTTISMQAGAQQVLTATEIDPDGTLRVTSSNVNVATVSESGGSYVVNGVSPGSATITVMDAQENTVMIPVTVSATAGGAIVVTTNADSGPGSLRSAIAIADATTNDTITFRCGSPCTIPLASALPPITSSVTIDGGAFGRVIIDGGSTHPGLFVDNGTVTIENLQIQNVRAKGGNGAVGGGGGLGAGAGIFVNQSTASLTVVNIYVTNASVSGGAGTYGAFLYGGGGGGLYFDGGVSGGGGVLAAGSGLGGGAGGGGGGGGNVVGPGKDAGTPGGVGFTTNAPGMAGSAGFGVLDGFNAYAGNGGNGGFGGGGGGGGGGESGGFSGIAPIAQNVLNSSSGGNGGFGGGGGSGGNSFGLGTGGDGGPGGGGGATSINGGAEGGVGGALATVKGGDAYLYSGGGGAAAGPAIFVNAGKLTVVNSGASRLSATPGAGSGSDNHIFGAPGTADATAVFNYAGSVNGSTTTGPISGAMGSSPPG